MINQVSFDLHALPSGATSIIPLIDGTSLIDLITDFEAERGYEELRGRYGGIIPEYMQYGPIDDYFMARGVSLCRQPDGAQYMLGCQCGEVGCWPLMATIRSTPSRYEWGEFHNPCRNMRDYSEFGSFVFERLSYERAVRDVATRLPARLNHFADISEFLARRTVPRARGFGSLNAPPCARINWFHAALCE